MTTPLIDLQDVTYAPGGTPVLTGITLGASERRIGIVGRNGSGKTSLIRVLTGLVTADFTVPRGLQTRILTGIA